MNSFSHNVIETVKSIPKGKTMTYAHGSIGPYNGLQGPSKQKLLEAEGAL